MRREGEREGGEGGPTSKGRGRKGRGKGREKGKGKGEGRGGQGQGPPRRNVWLRLWPTDLVSMEY